MRFGIKRQLLAVCIVTAAAVAAVGAVGAYTATDIWRNARVSYVDYTVALRDLATAGAELMDVGDHMDRAHTVGVGTPEDHAALDASIAKVDGLVTAYGGTVLRTSKEGRSERADFDAFQVEWTALKQLNEALDEPYHKALANPAAVVELTPLLAKVEAHNDKVRVTFGRLIETVGLVARDIHAGSERTYDRDGQILWLVVALTIVLVLGAGITQAIRLSRRLTDGVAALQTNSRDVTQAATEVATASQSLAQGAATQAASIEETSAALEQIATMTKRNASSANQSSEFTADARGTAETSAQLMGDLVTAMDAIKNSSDEIGKIIKVIDEIAFQTNMLALNAAVEAARAGEAGMGFAVVADEVRNLAQRSAQAARDTAGKIEESIRRSNNGVDITRRVHGSLAEIVGRVRKIDELSREISGASQEQARGIAQTNSAVAQMDRVTQQNASLADQVSTSATQLSSQAGLLLDVSAMLEAVLHGDGGAPPAAAPARTSTLVRAPMRTPAARRSFASGSSEIAAATPDGGMLNGHNGHNGVNGHSKVHSSSIPLPGDFVEF